MPNEMELSELAETPAAQPTTPRGAGDLEAVYDIPVTVSAVMEPVFWRLYALEW